MMFKIYKINGNNLSNCLKKNFVLILIAVAIIGMAISLAIGINQSVWFDEAYSIMLAKQPISQIIHLTSLDTHPPLYYLLLSLWGNLFGWGELALRSMSVIAMGSAVVVAGLFTRKVFGTKAALYSLPFMIFAPMLLRYGFEIRMYSLASLIGIAATYALVSAIETNNNRLKRILYLIYALLVALGMLTLYYMALLWIAHFIWLIINAKSNKVSVMKSMWLKSYIISVIMFLPWLPIFIKQLTNGALAPISQSMTLNNLLGIVSFSFVYRPDWQLGALLSLVILAVIVLLVYLSNRAMKIIDKRQKKYLQLLAVYIIVPVAVLTLVGLFRPMYVERYIAHVLIGASLFVGVSCSLLSSSKRRVDKLLPYLLVPVMLLGIIQLSCVGNYNFQRLQKPDVEMAASVVNYDNTSNMVLAADPYVAIELDYYISQPIYFYSDTASLGGGYANLSDNPLRIADPKKDLISSKKTIYYVYYDEPKLVMPDNYISVERQKFGQLSVDKFISK